MTEGKLYAKLAEVIDEVGYVAKDGKNDFQNYKYTSAEALLAAIRGPLSKRGVVVMPSLTAISEREYTTSKGKASILTTAHVQFTLVDSESGQQHVCEWAGQGDDPADKGLGKAYTNAIKTFLREQFLIPQGDDPEADKATDERSADRVGGSHRTAPEPVGPLASDDDVIAMEMASADLEIPDIKLALGSCGLGAVTKFPLVPASKVDAVIEALKKAAS